MMSSGAVGVRSSDTRRRATCLKWTNEPKRAVLVLQRDDGLTATPRLLVQELKINVTQLNLIKLTISDQSISSLHFPANFRYRVFSSSGHLRRWWWWWWEQWKVHKEVDKCKIKVRMSLKNNFLFQRWCAALHPSTWTSLAPVWTPRSASRPRTATRWPRERLQGRSGISWEDTLMNCWTDWWILK